MDGFVIRGADHMSGIDQVNSSAYWALQALTDVIKCSLTDDSHRHQSQLLAVNSIRNRVDKNIRFVESGQLYPDRERMLKSIVHNIEYYFDKVPSNTLSEHTYDVESKTLVIYGQEPHSYCYRMLFA